MNAWKHIWILTKFLTKTRIVSERKKERRKRELGEKRSRDRNGKERKQKCVCARMVACVGMWVPMGVRVFHLFRANDWGVGYQRIMDPWIGNQVCLKLTQILKQKNTSAVFILCDIVRIVNHAASFTGWYFQLKWIFMKHCGDEVISQVKHFATIEAKYC